MASKVVYRYQIDVMSNINFVIIEVRSILKETAKYGSIQRAPRFLLVVNSAWPIYKELVKAWLRHPIFQHFISSTEEIFGLFANWAEKYSVFPRRGLLPSQPCLPPLLQHQLWIICWGSNIGEH